MLIISYIYLVDDLSLCSKTPECLQKLIDGLFTYCKWHIMLSLTKTKVMVCNARKVQNHKFTCNNHEIETVTDYKYVSSVFSSKMKNSFKLNACHLIEKARKAIFLLNHKAQNTIWYLLPDLAIKMFDRQNKPILDYPSDIW